MENEIRGPQKRKPIHKTDPVDEIKDNVTNNAVVTRSKSRTYERKNKEVFNENQKKILNQTYEIEENSEDDTEEEIVVQTKTESTGKKQICTVFSVTFIFLSICIGLVAIAIYKNEAISHSFANNVITRKGDTDRIKNVLNNVKVTLKSMSSKYRNQEASLWRDVYFSISNVIREPKKPSIILLLGNTSDTLDCLAVLLGNVSSNALNSGTLHLTPDKFQVDVGEVIESLRLKIKNNKAVIIWDLLNINVEALKAFHNLCDRINPLVEEVIYIITVIADEYNKEMNPLEFIEKELFNRLSGKIKDDSIQPLITRITDGPILTIKPEPTIMDCPLPKVSKRS